MKRKEILLIALKFGFYLFANVVNVNAQNITQPAFKQIEIVKTDGIKQPELLYTLDINKKTTIIEYIDGLARPIQNILQKGSPNQKDIVQPLAYDQSGRNSTQYLPFVAGSTDGTFKPNSLNLQQAFYQNGNSDKIVDDVKPYFQKVFENSPMQRILKQGNLGDGFQPNQRSKAASFRTNVASDNVRVWKADGTSSVFYSPSSLQVSESVDEDGNKSLVFTDKVGRVILQRIQADNIVNGVSRPFLETYYVYNDVGRLKFMISPKAVAQMQTTGVWNLTGDLLNELVFSYVYDELGRVVEQKVPGAAATFIIYDDADRPILIQDANLRANNKWYYKKYGNKQQPISEGIYTNTTYTSRATMQAYVSSLKLNKRNWEERAAGTTFGYSNQIFPTTNVEELIYYYYDDYDFNKDGVQDFTYQSQSLEGEAVSSNNVRGYLTGVKKKIVGGTTWLTKVYFYDKKGNQIQELGNNQMYATVGDSKTVVKDFTGKILRSKSVKAISASSKTTVLATLNYDHGGRLKTITESYNGAPAIQLAAYEYNELGQLIKKNLHALGGTAATKDHIELGTADNVASGQSKVIVAAKSILLKNGFVAAQGSLFTAKINPGYLQSVDYRYDIQGRLTSINNSSLSVDNKNDDTDDLFGMEIFYNGIDNGIGNTAYFNGQISGIKWRTKTPLENNPREASYRYNYDKVGRLVNASYLDRASGGTWGNAGAFDEKGINYDENGNIVSLTRNVMLNGNISAMDNLVYTYQGNQLTNVSDGASASQGFKNLTGSNAAYNYTSSGNLSTDPKKGISIEYNILNKDEKITVSSVAGRFIKYSYDGAGILLSKQIYDGNVLKTTTNYSDGFVFENGTLAYFRMLEGRVRNTGAGLKPEYMLTDYQGNVRVSFEEKDGKAIVRQDNGYYPFGLLMPGNTVPSQPNKNLYNGGSEWQNDFADLPDYYKTHFRNYDAAIGRFIGVDVRANENPFVTPYHYALNNPVYYNDPLGDKEIPLKELLDSPYGGTYSSYGGGGGGIIFFNSNTDAFHFAAWENFSVWGMNGFENNYEAAIKRYNSMVSKEERASRVNFLNFQEWYRDDKGKPTSIDGNNAKISTVYLGIISNKKTGFNDLLKETQDVYNVVNEFNSTLDDYLKKAEIFDVNNKAVKKAAGITGKVQIGLDVTKHALDAGNGKIGAGRAAFRSLGVVGAAVGEHYVGSQVGAAIGSVFPGLGTAGGALVGALTSYGINQGVKITEEAYDVAAEGISTGYSNFINTINNNIMRYK
jgi:RHS repeat-associated protein